MASTDRQRWARVPPALAWKRPGLPTEWTRVIVEMPADMLNPLPPGYVLLDTRKDRPLRRWLRTWSSEADRTSKLRPLLDSSCTGT